MTKLTPFQKRRGGGGDDWDVVIPGSYSAYSLDYRELAIEEGLAAKGMGAVLKRNVPLMAVVVVLIGAIVGVFTALQPVKYTASALVMVNPAPAMIVNENQALNWSTPDSAVVDSEIEVIRSTDLLLRLAEELYSDKGAQGTLAFDETRIDELANVIDVRRRDLTFVIEVSATASDPAEAARMANGLVDIYMRSKKEVRQAAADNANVWFGDGLEQLRFDVNEKEAAVQAFRASQGLTEVAGVPVREQQLGELQRVVLNAKAEYAEKLSRFEQVSDLIASGASADTLAGVLNSEIIRELRMAESRAAQQLADASNTYGPEHPSMLRARAETAAAEKQIELEISRIVSNLSDEVQVSRARFSKLEAEQGKAMASVVASNVDLARLHQLQSDAAATRQVYEQMLQRSYEVSRQGNLPSVDIQLVSKALQPAQPSSPNWFISGAAALAGGFAIALLAVFFAEQSRKGLYTISDVRSYMGQPVIAAVPRINRGKLRSGDKNDSRLAGYLSRIEFSPFAESLRVMRSSLERQLNYEQSNVVAVTSAIPGEGKTTLTSALARIWALSGKSVIVVDCDVRGRSLSSRQSVPIHFGICEVLEGAGDWRDAVITEKDLPLSILPASAKRYSSKDVFSSPAMQALMQELSREYDIVVLDCPPVLVLADSTTVARSAGVVVLVCGWGKTPRKLVQMALERLRDSGTRVAGVAFNKVDPKAQMQGLHHGGPYVSRNTKPFYLSS